MTRSDEQLAITPATEEHLDAACAVLADCIEGMRAAGIDQWDDVYPNREVLLKDIRARTMYLAVAGLAGVAGLVVLNEYQDPEYADVSWTVADGPVAVVHRLMVRPRCARQVVGRALMRFVESEAARAGYGVIRLDAFTANPGALRLYHGLGYRDAGGVTFRKGPFRCFEKALSSASQLP